ncbi:MAG: SNF2-related protein, partial [Acidobacteriota bacterium]
KLTAAGVEVFGEAELTLAKINHARPTISFNVTSGIDWFDVKAVINFGELEVSLAEIRKSLRKKDRFIKLADGSVGEIPDEWLDKYKHLFGLSETKEDGFRVARHHLTLLDQLLNDNEQITTDKKFETDRAWLKNFQGISEQSLPAGFVGELRPYQKAGFDWLHFLREARFGGCLADDMGTGKTIQALCFLQSVKEQYEERNKRKRKKEPRAAHLLVVPRSLVTNWEREAQKFAPGLRILNFSYAERAADIKEFDDYDIVLTTYGILLREIERLREYEFDTVMLDEAQAIKNPVSESAKAARLLKCRNRLTLTGTPVENNTFELWSQFAFLNPGLLGSADYFRQEFTNPIERQQNEETTKSLRRLVYPFILRRTKDQVALDLPPRSEKILWNEMEPAQRKLYNLTRDEYRAKILKLIEDKGVKDARFRILEGLLRLRQICNHPRLVNPTYKGASAKLDTLMETLETLRAEDHKALIFSQFVQMLKLIEAELKKAKIPYTYLDGSTVNRQDRVDTFQTDEKIKVFLISLKAGGVGLNLTAADYVIHVDPWWNPAVEMQATDRAHRIGQDKPVFVYKLMMRDSVEEKILQLQDRKRTLVKQL